MSLIIFLIIGLIAGVLASYIMGRQQDLLVNLLIGIVGAVVGSLLAGLVGIGTSGLIGYHHRHGRRGDLPVGLAAHTVTRGFGGRREIRTMPRARLTLSLRGNRPRLGNAEIEHEESDERSGAEEQEAAWIARPVHHG